MSWGSVFLIVLLTVLTVLWFARRRQVRGSEVICSVRCVKCVKENFDLWKNKKRNISKVDDAFHFCLASLLGWWLPESIHVL